MQSKWSVLKPVVVAIAFLRTIVSQMQKAFPPVQSDEVIGLRWDDDIECQAESPTLSNDTPIEVTHPADAAAGTGTSTMRADALNSQKLERKTSVTTIQSRRKSQLLAVSFAPDLNRGILNRVKSFISGRTTTSTQRSGPALVEVIEYERPASSAASTPRWKRRLSGVVHPDDSDNDDDDDISFDLRPLPPLPFRLSVTSTRQGPAPWDIQHAPWKPPVSPRISASTRSKTVITNPFAVARKFSTGKDYRYDSLVENKESRTPATNPFELYQPVQQYRDRVSIPAPLHPQRRLSNMAQLDVEESWKTRRYSDMRRFSQRLSDTRRLSGVVQTLMDWDPME